MSTVPVMSILHVCIIVLSICRERALCQIFYGGGSQILAHALLATYCSHILVDALLAMYLMHEIFYQKQNQNETLLCTCNKCL